MLLTLRSVDCWDVAAEGFRIQRSVYVRRHWWCDVM